jgi:hypothetical protein
MSDTPETDHLEVQLGQAAMHSHPILWEHGRRMERERDEARKCAEDLRKLWFLYHSCMTGDPLKPVSNQPLPWEFSK